MLIELIKNLEPGCVIYKTSKGNVYHFIKFKNDKLYFDIPNNKKPKQPSVKSIPISYLVMVFNLLEQKREFARKASEFKDCRYTTIGAFAKLLFKEKLIVQRGKILLFK